MNRLHFSVYIIERDLLELKPELEAFLKIKELFHDAENQWEYMDGYSMFFDAKVTIFRELKERMNLPEDEKPLHISFFFKRLQDKSTTERIGLELNRFFKLPVFYGELRNTAGQKYELVPEKRFAKINLSGMIKTTGKVR
ncbi:hypothetical protein [Fluviicola sp.]|uniref:hypothetical protein n=1 Tax=Fluviicola sp. TaxID=1917219 RepID=UPI0031DC5912